MSDDERRYMTSAERIAAILRAVAQAVPADPCRRAKLRAEQSSADWAHRFVLGVLGLDPIARTAFEDALLAVDERASRQLMLRAVFSALFQVLDPELPDDDASKLASRMIDSLTCLGLEVEFMRRLASEPGGLRLKPEDPDPFGQVN